MEELTITKAYGWIFFNTRRFVETGDFLYGLGGNGPAVVEQMTGRWAEVDARRVFDDRGAPAGRSRAFARSRGSSPQRIA